MNNAVIAAASESGKKVRLRKRSADHPGVDIPGMVLFLPAALLLLALFVLPVGYAFYLGFTDITLIGPTAVHFHFAGFAAPVLAGLTGRRLGVSSAISRLFAFAVICIVGGTPLVAAGITFSATIALIGAVVISTGLVLLALLVLGWILRSLNSLVAQTLLVISSLSSICAMILASVYAYSLVTGRAIIDIPQMAVSHGLLNSVGFALCGLVAWSLVYSARHTSV